MNTLLLFALELALCLGISFGLIVLLKPLLRDVLTDICGSEKRADFWVMFTLLMLVISPLLVVVYFAPTAAITEFNVTNELQQALFRTLIGHFIALSVIGQVIWKSISSSHNRTLPHPVEGMK